MLPIVRGCLLAACLLLAAAPAARAQEGVTPDKRAAIRRLLELTAPEKAADVIFRRLVGAYQGPSAEALVAYMRARGAFKRFNPGQVAELERLVREASGKAYDDAKREVSAQVFTPGNVGASAAPVLDKSYTAEEVGALVAFFESPAGRKLAQAYPEAAADAIHAALNAKGAFDVPPSPTESLAKLERIAGEFAENDLQQLRQPLAEALRKRLTAGELVELDAFAATPLGAKVLKNSSEAHEQVYRAFLQAQTAKVTALSSQLWEAQAQVLTRRAQELYRQGQAGEGKAQPRP